VSGPQQPGQAYDPGQDAGIAKAWMILLGAGLLEIVWAIALKHSGGFTRLWPSVIGVSSAVGSFCMLSSALKSLPVGTGYAVWVGIGTLGVAIAGIVALGESASPLRLGCLALILVGIVGLKIVEAEGVRCRPPSRFLAGRRSACTTLIDTI
jgi:quaternary ammonium compound-resistance protein SugE